MKRRKKPVKLCLNHLIEMIVDFHFFIFERQSFKGCGFFSSSVASSLILKRDLVNQAHDYVQLIPNEAVSIDLGC